MNKTPVTRLNRGDSPKRLRDQAPARLASTATRMLTSVPDVLNSSPNENDLERHGTALGIDELRQERQEEERDLGIEHVRQHSLAEHRAHGGWRHRHLISRSRPTSQRTDPKPDEIGGADPLHDLEGDRHGAQQTGEAKRNRQRVHEAARGDAERGDDAGRTPLADAARDDVEHVGTGRDVEGERRRHEQQQGIRVRKAHAPLTPR